MNNDILLRFHNKIILTEDGCHEWIASLNNCNYGQFRVNKKSILAHRFSYELYKGSIPEDQVVDHLCENTKCVNPKHLQIITQKENLLKGKGCCSTNSKKTHCSRGHEFTPENTYINKRNSRMCRKCFRVRYKEKIGLYSKE